MRAVYFLLPLLLGPALLVPAAGPPARRATLTSRVVGSPDPLPPYRSRRVLDRHTFAFPVHLVSNPAHDLLFVVLQKGKIVHLPPSGKQQPAEFLQIADAETYSMTFHPRYATNKTVYVFANGPASKPKRTNQILAYKVIGDPPRCDPASRKLILEWESNGHNGGDLGFGPDGMLYITAGDGTSDSDTDNTGQDLSDLCSGMLRIDVDHPPPGKTYAIPPDNPFLKIKGARGELWAFGFRNPWRMTFDPVSGDLLVGDVGQDWWEMIQYVTRGSNHGWSVREGTQPFLPLRKVGPAPIVPPLIEHPHSESRSITGGIVYQGKRFPALRGTYVYGDYSTGKIWGLRQKHGKISWQGELAATRIQVVGFGADRDGELYLVDYAGQIHTLEPSPTVQNPAPFPRTLSETGLFLNVKGYVPHPALIPYTVNSPLWSDGAFKERAIALPGTETIGFTEDGPWQFPDLTVLVKTFSLDTPTGRQRIETRLLTRQEGEWFGYSYQWNEAQTEASLVEARGLNRTFRTSRGDIDWHYPSRAECMVCHTRAASYVLGLSTPQLNRDDQLARFQRLEVLRVPRNKHREALVEQGQRLGEGLLAGLRSSPARGLEKCCVQPVAKDLHRRTTDLLKKTEPKGTTSTLPLPASQYPRLVDPQDASASLNDRVRSYLQSNCAHCHVWAGGGNSAIDLHWKTPTDKMKLLDEKPLHDRFGVADARLVAPGAPERSILYLRMVRRGKGQMPPLASTCVDERAAELFRAWIRSLK